jgi:hypothetical protein
VQICNRRSARHTLEEGCKNPDQSLQVKEIAYFLEGCLVSRLRVSTRFVQHVGKGLLFFGMVGKGPQKDVKIRTKLAGLQTKGALVMVVGVVFTSRLGLHCGKIVGFEGVSSMHHRRR